MERRRRGAGWGRLSELIPLPTPTSPHTHMAGMNEADVRQAGDEDADWVACMTGGGRVRRVRRDTTSRYGPGALAEMEAALREDRGMAEDAVT